MVFTLPFGQNKHNVFTQTLAPIKKDTRNGRNN